MKAIMVMFDSLNRHMLQSYGCDWTITPNFSRLAQRSVQFENSYVCSMPCMPARRELHTGRPNFFHRSWGPMEPFDDSMPEILKQNGIYTHLISDHQHYWEDGGATYHNRYSSWEISRGQEGDNWKADLGATYQKETVFQAKKNHEPSRMTKQDNINRKYMDTEEKTAQAVTFSAGLDFLERNHEQDNWFLQIETFDPHEPFYSLPSDRALYPHHFVGDVEFLDADWPPYAPVEENEETVDLVRSHYAALVSKCDRSLGLVLDAMDRYNLWEDTMLIVNTDHGFLLGEHGWWGKTYMPIYDEISHTPFYIYDPRRKEKAGTHCDKIVQTIDLAPTLLEFFGQKIPKDMQGQSVCKAIDGASIHDYAAFGYHGSQIYVTDGRYTYRMSPEHTEEKVYEYTLMPTHMRNMFFPDELQNINLADPFSFTKGCRVMKIEKTERMGNTCAFGSALFDLKNDPLQNCVLEDPEIISRMKSYIKDAMNRSDAPTELYKRMGFEM